MKMASFRIPVRLAERSYEIVVARSDWQELAAMSARKPAGKRAVIVTDPNVWCHAQAIRQTFTANGFEILDAVIPSGESQKSMAGASVLYDRLAGWQADRSTLIVAVGGGVIGDLAGFVAATYARGLPWLIVPTTLLAMEDSSIGGKVGINHSLGKNLIGAFHQPIGVWINPEALATLPDREYRSGLAEVVKYGVILDGDLFAFLEKQAAAILHRDLDTVAEVIARCCRLKAGIVEQDEREESGLRAILNYGHTFAHAFETVSGYGHWLHGEAVSAGMICASRLAERRGLIPTSITERQVLLLRRFGLPLAPQPWPVEELLAIMRRDKKARHGRLRFILPVDIGRANSFADVPESEVRNVLAEATKRETVCSNPEGAEEL
jgi:3-dehydroquinate synthase